jgi:PAS domain S-box-containing protein
LGNWVDITERKKAEEALKESEAFNSSLLDNAPNPILVVNPDSSIRYANPALLKLTGFNRDEIIGKKFPYPWWTPEFIAEARKAGRLDTPQNVEDEVRFRKKNGEYFWVSASVRNVKNNESTWYLLGNWTDITESKQMEERIVDLYNTEKNQREELQEEARARGLFINVLAHELRTPVTPILASTGMLNDLLKDQPESIQKRLASNIFNSTQTLARRLEELLDLARYSRGTFKLQMQPADINKLIQNIVSQFQPTIDQRRQRLIIDLESEFPRAEIDPSRLEQVIINLLSNASKFSPEQGTIYLHARIENSNLRMDIRDEGIGIPSEEQGRLFQPYHRVEQDRQQFPGLGLGLAISKQIVEAHGGSIRVTSTPGQGSTFSFTIPLSKGC